jgi:hypothetical protein
MASGEALTCRNIDIKNLDVEILASLLVMAGLSRVNLL